ncbi:hypothetical protein NQ314_006616 [Rhamnusium bicolor]|uniref:Cytochrome P450 n=1 Tax=Rhamnusium bicolor TaxID=1586634 RepID=A0AAV8Z1Y9_9CUCU|nr:hypothetical protein NQ314_006616 [Rhamnusium bicolor]
MRSKLTPAFTVGKLKGMFSIINNIGLEMNQYIRKNLGQQEFKEICAKFSTDVIAKCAFGINSHCFEYEDANFREVGRSIFDFSWRNGIVHSSYFFMHGLAKLLRLNFFEKRAVTYLSDAFCNLFYMSSSFHNKMIVCYFLFLEGEKVVAQAIQFFAAGFETTSTTIAFTLYELCVQPQLQDKLRCEIINNIKENNGITYEALQNMKILEMCIMETLRKYPAVPFLDRRCNEDYKIDGTDIVIEKGMSVFIPTLALHYDPQYFPEPDKYKPERFSDKNNYNVDGLYYLPFGEGPRICIGERFGMLVTKLGLVHILSEFEVERIPDTPVPMEFEPKSLLLQSKVGLPMRVKEYQPISE